MRRSSISVALAGLLAMTVMPAAAQDIGLSELRGGIFAHSADEPGNIMGLLDASRIQDINVELLFDVPAMSDWLGWGELRPHLGATFNTAGLESMVYGGLSWTTPIADGPFFFEASFGGAMHNGSATNYGIATYPARDLGCTAFFRESVSLGLMLSDQASIMATVEHASNANICAGNRGLTNMGIRLGFRF